MVKPQTENLKDVVYFFIPRYTLVRSSSSMYEIELFNPTLIVIVIGYLKPFSCVKLFLLKKNTW